ncbi:hypothetical protein [Brevibacillus massiliensis]|jgi:hypothetical protein|uniref:hypothetical protein n=1 Tax=Brevibacillus massiliensis TaxID=1118054 RepID=UPI0003173071|nr:hypothetical protein [Brevibacillus massiliensis]
MAIPIQRKPPEDINAVTVAFIIKGIIGQRTVGIRKSEFEHLYQNLEGKDLSREQIIDELTKQWGKDTNYRPVM